MGSICVLCVKFCSHLASVLLFIRYLYYLIRIGPFAFIMRSLTPRKYGTYLSSVAVKIMKFIPTIFPSGIMDMVWMFAFKVCFTTTLKIKEKENIIILASISTIVEIP